jgi:hypothetical protein
MNIFIDCNDYSFIQEKLSNESNVNIVRFSSTPKREPEFKIAMLTQATLFNRLFV